MMPYPDRLIQALILGRSTLLIFCVVVMSIVQISAQEQHPYLSVGVVPTYMFDHITPSLGLEAEIGIVPKFRLALMYGLDYNQQTTSTSRFTSTEHFELKLTAKYLFWQRERLEQYFALDAFGTWQDASKVNDTYRRDGEDFNYTSAEIDRVVHGSRFLYGLRFTPLDRLWIDSSLGVGRRIVEIDYTTTGEEPGLYGGSWLFGDSYEDVEGRRSTVAVILAIKIEYRLL